MEFDEYTSFKQAKPCVQLGLWTNHSVIEKLVLLGGSVPIIFARLVYRQLNVRELEWWVNLSHRLLERRSLIG
jgi:hypothetical protein